MFQSYKYRIWIGVLFTAMFALGACTGEIPPELLEAVDAVESGGIEALEIDFSDLAEEGL